MSDNFNQESPDRKVARASFPTGSPIDGSTLSDLISMSDEQDVHFEPERLGLQARDIDI